MTAFMPFGLVAGALARLQDAGDEGPDNFLHLSGYPYYGLNALLQEELLGPRPHASGDHMRHSEAAQVLGGGNPAGARDWELPSSGQ
jgi:hypothetical protein